MYMYALIHASLQTPRLDRPLVLIHPQ
eukprot:COSAG06_NODE_24536_length_659_cov_1.903571_1_plen_26_part_01